MEHALEVDRLEFLDGLRLAKKGKALGAAVLSYEKGMLKVQFSRFYFKAHAFGQWYGEARTSAPFFKGLAQRPPRGDGPLRVVYENGEMAIGTASTRCKWIAIEPPTIELVPDASMVEILTVAARHSPQQIGQSGLAELVADTEKRRDALLAKAATILEPLGIEDDDLRRCLQDVLERESCG